MAVRDWRWLGAGRVLLLLARFADCFQTGQRQSVLMVELSGGVVIGNRLVVIADVAVGVAALEVSMGVAWI